MFEPSQVQKRRQNIQNIAVHMQSIEIVPVAGIPKWDAVMYVNSNIWPFFLSMFLIFPYREILRLQLTISLFL